LKIERKLTHLFFFQIEEDLLHPNAATEASHHKLKRLVQSPNSFFMDVKCPGCFQMCDILVIFVA
jgi:hypothetical protein